MTAYVRIPCRSQADAKEFALRLEADGYTVRRRWKAVIACTETRHEAELLARKLHLETRTDTESLRKPSWSSRFAIVTRP